MSFISIEFFLFLTFTVCIYHCLAVQHRKLFLLILSYLFYLSWSFKYALLMFAITTAVYRAALKMDETSAENKRGVFLKSSVSSLMFILIFFKISGALHPYFSALLTNTNVGFIRLLFPTAVPLGLSYYSFKLISYVIDIFLGKIQAEKEFTSFACYVSFFPQIVCGPIQRAGDFLPQVKSIQSTHPDLIASGLRLILFGLFKKFVVAESLKDHVDEIFKLTDRTFFRDGLGMYFFAFQMYADFSGITDIAIGVGRLFGFHSPNNFNCPFQAPNVREFWRRWHMTLTTWLSDYLFTPLWTYLRYRKSIGLYFAILVNMIAIGLWHGVTLNFLIFGLLNGIFMTFSVMTLKKRDIFFEQHKILSSFRRWAGPLITFHLIAFSFIFIRADTPAAAIQVILKHLMVIKWFLVNMKNVNDIIQNVFILCFGLGKIEFYTICFVVAVMEGVHIIRKNEFLKSRFLSLPKWVHWIAYYLIILLLIFVGKFGRYKFIYQQF